MVERSELVPLPQLWIQVCLVALMMCGPSETLTYGTAKAISNIQAFRTL